VNIAELSIKNSLSMTVLAVLVAVGGIIAYMGLGRLEDPEFAIKTAVVTTTYPGATAEEVEKEVTDKIEIATQKLGQLDYVWSISRPGLSMVTCEIKDQFNTKALPQVWDELRRKVGDVQSQLPPGAGPSLVNDDFGDVYGVCYALVGDGYSIVDLYYYAKFLKRELLLCDDVAKVEMFGTQLERIYVEFSRERLANLGFSKEDVLKQLASKNLVASAGKTNLGPEYLQIVPTGDFDSLDDFRAIQISGKVLTRGQSRGKNTITLGDVATITRGVVDPPSNPIMRRNGKPSIYLGISCVQGGNVITLGNSVDKKLAELYKTMPFGMALSPVYNQPEAVTNSISAFIVNLVEAVAIVIIVLLVFMGVRAGLLIGSVLMITILGTFILMSYFGIMLERISLGALIIALGMLVDNAIVVTDGILVRITKGEDRIKAAREVVDQTFWPLLGATAIAIIAFAAIGTSNDSTGEFCKSLFTVLMFSLGFSWVTAVTITPLACVKFLKVPETKENEEKVDGYDTPFYHRYKSGLLFCMKYKYLTLAITGIFLAIALFSFKFVEKSFFPSSTTPQLMVDLWLREGTDIRVTEEYMKKAEKYILGLEHVKGISTSTGQGFPRIVLTYTATKPNSAYGFILVDVDGWQAIDELGITIKDGLSKLMPDTIVYPYKFMLGPGGAVLFECRISGPNLNVLNDLSAQVEDILFEDGGFQTIQTDWRTQVTQIKPQLNEARSKQTGIERVDVAKALEEAYVGQNVGVYRESDELIPIVSRAPEAERKNLSNMYEIPVWSQIAGKTIPMGQVLDGFEPISVNNQIWRRSRQRCVTIQANPMIGLIAVPFSRVKEKIENLNFPPGYSMEWGGEFEDSQDAQGPLLASIPIFAILMFLIIILLFNNLKQPIIICMVVPLCLIGVTGGLLGFNAPFGFMSLLGVFSLSGMLIKNGIVLLDEVNVNTDQREQTMTDAVVNAGISRILPVSMAAATTMLGMLPLAIDPFYSAMAVTIIGGLLVGTVLTLIIIPVLSAVFYSLEIK